jgi:hypothetical protein
MGADAVLDHGQQPAHGRAVADPDVGQLRLVHVGAGDQQVHGPAQVHDELDLLMAILRGAADAATDGALWVVESLKGTSIRTATAPVRARSIPTGSRGLFGVWQAVLDDEALGTALPVRDDPQRRASPPLGLAWVIECMVTPRISWADSLVVIAILVMGRGRRSWLKT